MNPPPNDALRAWQLSLYETPAPHAPEPMPRYPREALVVVRPFYDAEWGVSLWTDDPESVGAE